MGAENVAKQKQSMRLGNVEFYSVNNPIKKFLQKYIEFHIFKKLLFKNNINLVNKVIMDGGCGSGYSTKLILEEFNPAEIIAFDYMPEQIALAKKQKIGVEFFTGDLTDIKLKSNLCDAVFIFGVIHHIPDWKKALSEVNRILRPGGCLLLEEPHVRLSWEELESGLKAEQFHIQDQKQFFFGFVHSYLCIKE